jgi:hypothetical protein
MANEFTHKRRRLTNGKPALANWIGDVETKVGLMQSARFIAFRHGMETVIGGGLQRRFA